MFEHSNFVDTVVMANIMIVLMLIAGTEDRIININNQ